MNKILLDAGSEGGGGDALKFDVSVLPEEIRNEPSLASIKTIPDLAKSFVHSQKLIGTDKIPKPQKTWTEAQWSDFYKNIGRPETHDKYSFKPEAVPEGVTIDDAKLGEAKQALHKLGLTDAQASGALKYYLDSIGASTKSMSEAAKVAKTQAISALKEEYKDDFDAKINIAKSVVRKFGSEELLAKLESTGIGDDPVFIKLFVGIGEAIMDDKTIGSTLGTMTGGPGAALTELNLLKQDKDFITTLSDRSAPGHKQALERWESLHKQAYPEKK